MPGPYKPPQVRRAQAVRSARGISLQRWWWLAPLIGLVPVVTVLALVSRGGGGAPVASGPTAAPTIQPAATVTTQVALIATTQPLAAPTPIATATTAQGTNTNTSAAAAPATPSTASTTAPPLSTTPASSTFSEPYVAYRVQAGDTVRFIAQTYGVSPISIAQASGLQNPDVLRVGQVLTIPAQPGWLYRLQPGETLDQVSARTGVASSTIASASGLAAASVGPGSVILIPDQTLALGK